jgi:hypothetical protein
MGWNKIKKFWVLFSSAKWFRTEFLAFFLSSAKWFGTPFKYFYLPWNGSEGIPSIFRSAQQTV